MKGRKGITDPSPLSVWPRVYRVETEGTEAFTARITEQKQTQAYVFLSVRSVFCSP